MGFFSVVGKLLGLVPGVVQAVQAVGGAFVKKQPLKHLWTAYEGYIDPKTGEKRLRQVTPERCRACKQTRELPQEFQACPGGRID